MLVRCDDCCPGHAANIDTDIQLNECCRRDTTSVNNGVYEHMSVNKLVKMCMNDTKAETDFNNKMNCVGYCPVVMVIVVVVLM